MGACKNNIQMFKVKNLSAASFPGFIIKKIKVILGGRLSLCHELLTHCCCLTFTAIVRPNRRARSDDPNSIRTIYSDYFNYDYCFYLYNI